VIPTERTKFFYQADQASDWEELESDFPFDAIPYILIFDDKVTKIELRLPQHEAAYARAGSEELENGGRLTTIKGLESAAHFLPYEKNGITAAVPIAERRMEALRYCLRVRCDTFRSLEFAPATTVLTAGFPCGINIRTAVIRETRKMGWGSLALARRLRCNARAQFDQRLPIHNLMWR
jgi:hypothetical protein